MTCATTLLFVTSLCSTRWMILLVFLERERGGCFRLTGRVCSYKNASSAIVCITCSVQINIGSASMAIIPLWDWTHVSYCLRPENLPAHSWSPAPRFRWTGHGRGWLQEPGAQQRKKRLWSNKVTRLLSPGRYVKDKRSLMSFSFVFFSLSLSPRHSGLC